MVRRKAIVVGGGIGGLTTAAALGQAGLEVALFERRGHASRVQVGTGLNLWANALQALSQLGLAEQVEAKGWHLEWFEHRSARGALLARWAVGEIGRRFGAATISVSRADLHGVLAASLPEGVVTLGANCIGFSQDEDGVRGLFDDGREESGDLLIGADGINSVTRARLFPGEGKPRYAGYAAWRGISPARHTLAPVDTFRLFWGPGLRFGYYHLDPEHLYWFAVANAPEEEPGGGLGRQARVRSQFRGWPEPIETMVAATPESLIQWTAIYDRDPIERWSAGRVTLVGDAAHPMTFNVGQGACQAIEDGVILAGCLRAEDDVARALRAYESRRTARTAAMMRLARRLGELGRWENPLACLVRDGLMKLLLDRVGTKGQERDFAFAAVPTASRPPASRPSP
jgi:2-polyprenyl-6-methoxyphenol hydroxylase-like FAD-dependent oxidoreductase